jgi:hypothetical protein
MLFVDRCGDGTYVGITAVEAEEMTLSLLAHIAIYLQPNVSLDIGSRTQVLKLPQP